MARRAKWYHQPAVVAAIVAGIFAVVVALIEVAGPGVWPGEKPGTVVTTPLEGWMALATYRGGRLEMPVVTISGARPSVDTVYQTERPGILWSALSERSERKRLADLAIGTRVHVLETRDVVAGGGLTVVMGRVRIR